MRLRKRLFSKWTDEEINRRNDILRHNKDVDFKMRKDLVHLGNKFKKSHPKLIARREKEGQELEQEWEKEKQKKIPWYIKSRALRTAMKETKETSNDMLRDKERLVYRRGRWVRKKRSLLGRIKDGIIDYPKNLINAYKNTKVGLHEQEAWNRAVGKVKCKPKTREEKKYEKDRENIQNKYLPKFYK